MRCPKTLLPVIAAFLAATALPASHAGTVTVDIVKHLDQRIQLRALNSRATSCVWLRPARSNESNGPYSPERKSVTCKTAACQLRLLRMVPLPQGEQDWSMFYKVWFAWPLDPKNFDARCSPAWLFPGNLFTIDFRMDLYDGPVIYPGSSCASLGIGCPAGYERESRSAADWTNVTAVILPVHDRKSRRARWREPPSFSEGQPPHGLRTAGYGYL